MTGLIDVWYSNPHILNISFHGVQCNDEDSSLTRVQNLDTNQHHRKYFIRETNPPYDNRSNLGSE